MSERRTQFQQTYEKICDVAFSPEFNVRDRERMLKRLISLMPQFGDVTEKEAQRLKSGIELFIGEQHPAIMPNLSLADFQIRFMPASELFTHENLDLNSREAIVLTVISRMQKQGELGYRECEDLTDWIRDVVKHSRVVEKVYGFADPRKI